MLSRLTLILLHLLGDALLLWVGYHWLGMDESDGRHLLVSFGSIALLIVGAAWLHGVALAHFAGLPLHRSAVRSLRSLVPLILLCVLALAIYGALGWIKAAYSRPAFLIASFLTLRFHSPIAPAMIEKVFHALVLALEWGVVPGILISVGARVATTGWNGFRENPLRRPSFWVFSIAVAALLVCAIWVPLKLFFWIPNISSFGGQFASLILRVGFGYLLFVLSILFLEFITASGRPLETQPSTAVRP